MIETEGSKDVVMSVFGPDSQTRLIARSDGSTETPRTRLELGLDEGRYYARVVHHDAAARSPIGSGCVPCDRPRAAP